MNLKLEKKFGTAPRGFAPIVIVIFLVLAALAAGAGVYVYRAGKTSPPAGAPADKDGGQPVVGAPGESGNGLDSLQVAAPGFEVPSSSALPSLQASALNLSSASLPSTGVFRDFTAKTDTSYSYKLDIAVPEVQLDVPTAPAETTAPSGSTGGSSGSGGQTTTPSAANCAQFSSMPSAQYCSAVSDPNGAELCRACKAAGF